MSFAYIKFLPFFQKKRQKTLIEKSSFQLCGDGKTLVVFLRNGVDFIGTLRRLSKIVLFAIFHLLLFYYVPFMIAKHILNCSKTLSIKLQIPIRIKSAAAKIRQYPSYPPHQQRKIFVTASFQNHCLFSNSASFSEKISFLSINSISA